ncbi:cyclic nucleotide-binding domain-containing protein [Azospirillum sp.]|uniref:cyclic nucleotide-binding domain-containing protein n=1 Tax=Azospirillum sp. TaxID=34012 RepID=UPI003D73BFB7
MKMHYRVGDALFREGDPSDFACRILEGRVSVVKESQGSPVVLGEIAAGAIVGEMGVLEHKPRSATVRAVTEVLVEVIPADAFLPTISADPDTAHALMLRLSERVRTLSDEVARLRNASGEPGAVAGLPVPAPDAPPVNPVTERKIASYVHSARLTMGVRDIGIRMRGMPESQTVWIDALPFRVGRTPDGWAAATRDRASLRLPDVAPHRLSPNHFVIDRDDRLGLVVRDVGSELGTTVNGQYIGGIFAKDAMHLQSGTNTVVAGGRDSPFVFEVLVQG